MVDSAGRRFWAGVGAGVAVAVLLVAATVVTGILQPTLNPPLWPETLRYRDLSNAERMAPMVPEPGRARILPVRP